MRLQLQRCPCAPQKAHVPKPYTQTLPGTPSTQPTIEAKMTRLLQIRGSG